MSFEENLENWRSFSQHHPTAYHQVNQNIDKNIALDFKSSHHKEKMYNCVEVVDVH